MSVELQDQRCTVIVAEDGATVVAVTPELSVVSVGIQGPPGADVPISGLAPGRVLVGASLAAVEASQQFRFSGGAVRVLTDDAEIHLGAASDVQLHRDAAGVLSLRSAATPQQFRVYNDGADIANAEWFRVSWQEFGDQCFVGPTATGAGAERLMVLTGSALVLRTAGANRWFLAGDGHIHPYADGVYDFGQPASRPRNVYAGTAVDTPLLTGTSVDVKPRGSLRLGANSILSWQIDTGSTYPTLDSTYAIGFWGKRVGEVVSNQFTAYNSVTDAANYERARQYWSGDVYYIRTASAGSGTPRPLRIIGQAGMGFGGGSSIQWVCNTAGTLYPATTLTHQLGSASFEINGVYSDEFLSGGIKVVGARRTGWAAPTGNAARTTFDPATVTLSELAERLHALINDLTTHGLIGA